MQAIINAGTPHGAVQAPPSKSVVHREIICSALAAGKSTISGAAMSKDIEATIRAVRALGAEISQEKEKDSGGLALGVRGIGTDIGSSGISMVSGVCGRPGEGASGGPASCAANAGERVSGGLPVLDCGESGSTLRFMIPVALLNGGGRFTCAPRLIERGISVYEDALSPLGIEISIHRDTSEILTRGRLRPGAFEIPGDVSSQFVSGLLFALPLLEGDSRISVRPPVESRPYIDITADILKKAGIRLDIRDDTAAGGGIAFGIPGNQKYISRHWDAEGDWSNGAFLLGMNTLAKYGPASVPACGSADEPIGGCAGTAGARSAGAIEDIGVDTSEGGRPLVQVSGLDPDSCQGDKVCVELLEAAGRWQAGDPAIDISGCPDLGPVLMAVGAACGGCELTGTARLRIKESDRAQAMAGELAKFGIGVDVFEDSVTVEPGRLAAPAEALDGHNDHRIVMSLALLASITGGRIDGCQAVSKSWPEFWDVFRSLGMEVEIVDI